jgi:quinol monooxygenase YgiN
LVDHVLVGCEEVRAHLVRIERSVKRNDTIRSVHQSLSSKQGYARCSAYGSIENPNQLLYIEQWTTRRALYCHIQSDLYRRILSLMELANETLEISFHETVQVGGMELIKDLREERVP